MKFLQLLISLAIITMSSTTGGRVAGAATTADGKTRTAGELVVIEKHLACKYEHWLYCKLHTDAKSKGFCQVFMIYLIIISKSKSLSKLEFKKT